MNKQEQIKQYLDETFEALAKINPDLASADKRQRANELFLNAEVDFETVKEKMDKAKNQLIEEYQKKLAEKEEFIAKMNSLNLSMNTDMPSFFGETFKPHLVPIMKAFEEIEKSNELSYDEKKDLFLKQKKQIIESYTKLYKNMSSRQTRDIKMQERILNETFRGYDTLDYETMKNLYKIFKEDINIIVPSSSGKMRITIDNNAQVFMPDGSINPNLYDFSLMEDIYKYAKENGKELKFHTILWHKHVPENLQREILSMSPEKQRETTLFFLNDYISHLSEWARTNGFEFRQIDVLNEIASDKDHSDPLRKSFWRDVIGDDYFIEVLKIAKKQFPNSELLYNDYNEFIPEKCDNMCHIIKMITEYEEKTGIKLLDGIGMQSHYDTLSATPETVYETTYKLSQFGKPLYRTEFDFLDIAEDINRDIQLTDKEKERKIAREVAKKEEIMDAIHLADEQANVNGFIMWGNSDRLTWERCEGKDCHIIDKHGKPKKEYIDFKEQFSEGVIVNSYEEIPKHSLIQEPALESNIGKEGEMSNIGGPHR